MLHREANYFGQGSSAGARVKAQIQLSKIFGMEQVITIAQIEHPGGVMIVPMASSIEDWEQEAKSSQAKLIDNTV